MTGFWGRFLVFLEAQHLHAENSETQHQGTQKTRSLAPKNPKIRKLSAKEAETMLPNLAGVIHILSSLACGISLEIGLELKARERGCRDH